MVPEGNKMFNSSLMAAQGSKWVMNYANVRILEGSHIFDAQGCHELIM